MRRYQGQFKSLHNENTYYVQIDCSLESGNQVELTLGPSPFVTNMDGGSNTIYVPVKYSGATVQVVADNYYFGMYSSTPKQNAVRLYDGSTNDASLVWTGYTSPNVYSADYNFETESWEVEAIDGLSVLKYYDYKPLFNNNKTFVTFTQIINACLEKCGCYSKWYFSRGTYYPGASSRPLTDGLLISEADFFDEDETPMKMNEVLEEVCKYCGVTAMAYRNAVYFIDYDAVKAPDASTLCHSFFVYDVGNTTSTGSTTLNEKYTIDKDTYSSTGSTLSLDNVYSKVTVRDSLYTVKSIIPSMFEDEDLRNIKYDSSDNQNWNWEYTQKCCWLGDNLYDVKADEDNTYFYIKSRYYTNDKYNHYFYDSSSNVYTGPIISSNGHDSSALWDLTKHTGALFSRFNLSSGKTRPAAMNGLDYGNFDNYLMLPMNYSATAGLKRLETKSEQAKPFFMSGKTALIVKGSLILTDRAIFNSFEKTGSYKPSLWYSAIELHKDVSVGYFPITDTIEADFDGRGWWIFYHGNSIKMTQNNLTLRVDVSIGGQAITNDVAFYPYGEGDASIAEDNKHHEIFYKSFDVQNNVNYTYNINDKGYILTTGLNTNAVVPAKPIVSIYGMDKLQTIFGLFTSKSPLGAVFIKDFDIQAVVPHEGGKDENDTATEYSYVIDEDYVQELSPIEFKICTYDNKQLNYSSVAWVPQSGDMSFVDKLVSRSLGHTERSEHLMCYRIVHQYTSPSRKLSCNLFIKNKSNKVIAPWTKVIETELNRDFIVDSVSYDYFLETAVCNLVEKK